MRAGDSLAIDQELPVTCSAERVDMPVLCVGSGGGAFNRCLGILTSSRRLRVWVSPVISVALGLPAGGVHVHLSLTREASGKVGYRQSQGVGRGVSCLGILWTYLSTARDTGHATFVPPLCPERDWESEAEPIAEVGGSCRKHSVSHPQEWGALKLLW